MATGIQYGKTTIGALWMKMRMHEYTDESDNFIITSPTYKILQQSTLPPFLRWMDGYGTYHRQDAMFQMHNGGRCYFRTATDADSIVGITNVRAIYGDEAGLYSLYFWENMQARAAFKSARILLTTSPYTLNWVYKDLIRPKQKDHEARPDVCYVKAKSSDNPYFPKEYFERMRETMDDRRFKAMFGGEWSKMDGLVYNCFDPDTHVVSPAHVEIQKNARWYAGVDWGTTAPFVITVRFIQPDLQGRMIHYQVMEVYQTGLTIFEMIRAAKGVMSYWPIETFFCDPSSPGYISEFNRAGIPAIAANNDIKMGIDLHYQLIKDGRFFLFSNDNKFSIDELETYHYPADKEIKADSKVDDQIPVKQGDHAMDSMRYVTVHTFTGAHRNPMKVVSPSEVPVKHTFLDERAWQHYQNVRKPSKPRLY